MPSRRLPPAAEVTPNNDSARSEEEIALKALRVSDLRALARANDWPLRGLRRDEIVEQILDYYEDPQAMATLVARLTVQEQRLLALLAWLGPQYEGTVLRRLESLKRLLPPDWLTLPPTKESLEPLYERGLYLQLQLPAGRVHQIAPTVEPHLPPVDALHRPVAAPSAARKHVPPPPFLDQLLRVWAACKRMEPLVLQGFLTHPNGFYAAYNPYSGGALPLPRALVEQERLGRIASAAGLPEAQCAFLLALLVTVELADIEKNFQTGGTLEAHFPLEVLISLLRTVAEGELDALWRAEWEVIPPHIWNELALVDQRRSALVAYGGKGLWGHNLASSMTTAFLTARSLLSRQLAHLRPAPGQPAKWQSWPDLMELYQQLWPTLLVDPHRAWYLAVRPGTPADGAKRDEWEATVGRLLEAMLLGPLRWMGWVEVATDSAGALLAIRATTPEARPGARGAASAEQAVRWRAEERRVQLRPSADTTPLLALLSQYALFEGVSGDSFLFLFTQAKSGEAFQSGETAATLIKRFKEGGTPLPTPLRARLNEWWDAWGKVHRYEGVALVELGSELLARELMATTELGKVAISRLSPTCFVVPEEAVDQLLSQMERATHTPKIIRA